MDSFVTGWHNWSMERDARRADVTSEGQSPDDFTKLVRDALAHLYDPAHLLGHPLTELLAPVLPASGNAAQSLRAYLLDAIECLAPPGRASTKDQRPHTVLVQRYVGGLSIDDIAAFLHLGARQVRREHEEGVAALAAYLWGFCSGSWQGPQHGASETGTSGSGLEAELAALGVELVSLPLAELVASVRSAARALAGGCGTALNLAGDSGATGTQTAGAGARCLCDRTLARQALLATIGAFAHFRPRYIDIRVTESPGHPGLEISALPPVELGGDEESRQELHKARAFMAAQGGILRLRQAQDGHCLSACLLFRPEGQARVLVVDDNEKILQLYTRYLSLGSYEVLGAASAAEAEATLSQQRPDAIVLDVMMRGPDGWELLERLRARPELARVPIIVCSVLDEPRLASLLGAQACLKKPVMAEDLLQTLRRLLEPSSPEEQHPPAR